MAKTEEPKVVKLLAIEIQDEVIPLTQIHGFKKSENSTPYNDNYRVILNPTTGEGIHNHIPYANYNIRFDSSKERDRFYDFLKEALSEVVNIKSFSYEL